MVPVFLVAGVQFLTIDEHSIVKNCSSPMASAGAISLLGNSSGTIQGEYTGCYSSKQGAAFYSNTTSLATVFKNINVHNNVFNGVGTIYSIDDITLEGKVVIHDNYD